MSRALLMRDARFPWAILVPRQVGLVELVDLAREDRIQLLDEITALGDALKAETRCMKLNVGAIGNMVRQLHIHVVARFDDDAAWPKPVWGHGTALPYAPGEMDRLASALATRLGK